MIIHNFLKIIDIQSLFFTVEHLFFLFGWNVALVDSDLSYIHDFVSIIFRRNTFSVSDFKQTFVFCVFPHFCFISVRYPSNS